MISKTQRNILENLKGGCTLSRKDRLYTLKFSNGMVSKVRSDTFYALYNGRYIDPNGEVFGESHYKISEKGLSTLKI